MYAFWMKRKEQRHTGERRNSHFSFHKSIILYCTLLCSAGIPQALAQNSPSESFRRGQQLFDSSCSGCHGLDGRGGEHGPNVATSREAEELNYHDILRIVRDGIAAAGMPAFRSKLSEAEMNALVSYVRVLQGKHAATSLAGDPKQGRALFFGRARCSECHMIAGEGGFIASDLSGYGNEHSPDIIRNAILDPNKNLDPRNQTLIVATRAGREFKGVALNEDNFSLQLQTLDGAFHLFAKSTLAKIEREPKSIMPSDYASTLSPSELDDVVTYLASAGRTAVTKEPH